jgi:hypothetical protein
MIILEIVAQYVDTPEDKRGSPRDYTHNFKLALPKYEFFDMTDLFLEMDGSEPFWVDSLYAIWAHYNWRIDGYEYGAFAPHDAYQLIEWYIHERNRSQQLRSGKAADAAENQDGISYLDIDVLLEDLEIRKPIPCGLNVYRCFFFEMRMRPQNTTLYAGGFNAETKKIQQQLKRASETTRKEWSYQRFG